MTIRVSSLSLLLLALSTGANARPRNVHPTTPDQIYQNDRDLTSDIKAALLLQEQTPAQFTVSQNDFSISDNAILRVSTNSGAVAVTGFAGGSKGRWFILVNVGANNIILSNQNAGSSAANRTITKTGADVTITPNNGALILYDSVTQRWRLLFD